MTHKHDMGECTDPKHEKVLPIPNAIYGCANPKHIAPQPTSSPELTPFNILSGFEHQLDQAKAAGKMREEIYQSIYADAEAAIQAHIAAEVAMEREEAAIVASWEANRQLAVRLHERLYGTDPDDTKGMDRLRAEMLRELFDLTQIEGEFIPGTKVRPAQLPTQGDDK